MEQDRLDLQGPLEEIRERLEDVLDSERSALSLRPDHDARDRESFLDALPADVAGKLRELREYRFVDPEAFAADPWQAVYQGLQLFGLNGDWTRASRYPPAPRRRRSCSPMMRKR